MADKRSHILKVRLSTDELHELDLRARAAGVRSLAGYVRMRALAKTAGCHELAEEIGRIGLLLSAEGPLRRARLDRVIVAFAQLRSDIGKGHQS